MLTCNRSKKEQVLQLRAHTLCVCNIERTVYVLKHNNRLYFGHSEALTTQSVAALTRILRKLSYSHFSYHAPTLLLCTCYTYMHSDLVVATKRHRHHMHTKTAAFTQTEQLPITFSSHNRTGIVANLSRASRVTEYTVPSLIILNNVH